MVRQLPAGKPFRRLGCARSGANPPKLGDGAESRHSEDQLRVTFRRWRFTLCAERLVGLEAHRTT